MPVTRDEGLWDRTDVGDAEIEELYAKHASALVRFAATLVGPTDAEDLVAVVMLNLLRARDRDVSDLRSYAYRSVLNAARKHVRALTRRERREHWTALGEAYLPSEFAPEVVAALGALSPQQRAAVHLTYWEDLTPAAVAARLGVGEGTIRRQLARARHKLSEVLDAP